MRLFARIACGASLIPLMACASAEFRPRAVANAFVMQGDADAALADARFQFDAANYGLAISGYRRALREAPANIEAYIGLSQSYDRLGRFDLARRYYEEGLALAPDDPSLRRSYAAALRARGMEADARALEDAPVHHADAADSMPTTHTASFTIELPDPPPLDMAAPAPVQAEVVPRLERVSQAEVTLVTVQRPPGPTPAPAPRAAPREARAVPAQSLPIRLVRNTGRELVWELDPAPPQPVRETSASVRVLNAVGRRGQAGRMRSHVRTLGWAQVSVGDASVRRIRSRIVCTPREAAEARRLAEALPFRPAVVISPSARHLFLVLGRDATPFDDRLMIGRGAS